MSAGVVTGASLVVLLACACSDPGGTEVPPDGPVCVTAEARSAAGCATIVGESFPCEAPRHVEEDELLWNTNPPQSGPHFPPPRWEHTRGEHEEVVARGAWVHNLEHGWVVLLHNCPTGCEAELQVLRDVVAQRPDSRIIMTPDPILDPPRFAAVSWTWIYETDAPDAATLLCFVDQHERQAPEDVP